MKKYILSIFVFIASGAYVAYQYANGSTIRAVPQTDTQVAQTTSNDSSAASSVPPNPTGSKSAPQQAQSAQTQTTPQPTPAPASKPKGQYVDGSYTGSVVDAYYGLVQVRATIEGGKLTNVTFLQYPNDRSTSQYINSQAMPILTQEAIQAQSAHVSGVSGASDTSVAFQQSLGNALAQAKS